MTGDTIVVNGKNEEERRVKRVRRNKDVPTSYRFKQYMGTRNNKILINQENLGAKAALRTSESIQNAQYGTADRPSLSASSCAPLPHPSIPPAQRSLISPPYSVTKSASESSRPNKPLQFKPYAPRAKSQPQSSAQTNGNSTAAENSDPAHSKFESIPVVSQHPSSHSRRVVTRRTAEHPGVISFFAAPNNSVELAWWLAHHISHLENSDNPSSQSPLPSTHHNDQSGPFFGARPDKIYSKEQARKRQQRWRASNRLRSMICTTNC